MGLPTVDNETLAAGQLFTLSVTVRNRSAGSLSATTLRYYRSADSTISPNDDAAGMAQIPALDAFESSHRSITRIAPSTPGTYHYGACVDPTPGESVTADNCSDAVVVTVLRFPTPRPTPFPTPRPTPETRPWPTYVATTTTAWPPLPPVKADMAEARSSRLTWLTDDVRAAINDLRVRGPDLAAQIEDLSWIADGIQLDMEAYAVRGLIALADAGQLARFIEEPWVAEGRNHPALRNLAINNISYDPPEVYNWVVDHPALNDGISDREAKILASLGSPDDSSRLDSGSPHTIEERTIILPLAGEVELTIIRTDLERGYAGMMNDLEHSIRSHEEFMGVPFPQRQVNYLIKPGGGGNWSESFVYVGDSYHDGPYPHTIAHEAAHYHWTWPRAGWTPFPANLAWVSEGAAELLAYGPDAARVDWVEDEWNAPCVGLTITELEASDFALERDGGSQCWYPVGEAFYRDLYRAMESTNFRLAFRRWLLHSMFDLADVCVGDDMGISTTYCHVMEAFTTYASEDNRAAVEDVINRWYGHTP